jgi:hypothetical protein
VLSYGGEQLTLFSDFLHLRVPSVEEPGVGVTRTIALSLKDRLLKFTLR